MHDVSPKLIPVNSPESSSAVVLCPVKIIACAVPADVSCVIWYSTRYHVFVDRVVVDVHTGAAAESMMRSFRVVNNWMRARAVPPVFVEYTDELPPGAAVT